MAVARTESYNVTVATQPAGQSCWENYSQGNDLIADVTNVIIECLTSETLWNFGVGLDGVIPLTSLIQGADGALYGTTSQGGSGNGFGGTSGYGAVFRVTLDGHESVLWNFAAGADGVFPVGALVIGADGNFYGTTCRGGANGLGVVYKLTPAGVESILWNFGAGSDGQCPEAGLTLGSDGNFYGTTNDGGAAGYGTVFRITPDGVETVLWSFGATADDGRNPQASLLETSSGILYGTTVYGGHEDGGTVFSITSAGTETVLWRFGSSSGRMDGLHPTVKLIEGADGYLYGTTADGGNPPQGGGAGTVFRLSKGADQSTGQSDESVFWAFGDSGYWDGRGPWGLTMGRDGNFYGTTFGGGQAGRGTAFKITPAGVESVIWSSISVGIIAPREALLQASDGNFYGTSEAGGAQGHGGVFRLNQ